MSRSFRDTTGQRWHVPLDVALVERVRAESGVDLLAPETVPRMLQADPVLTWQVLSVLLGSCESCCTRQQRIAPDELSRRLKGETLTAAARAIVEAITDFFLPPRRTGPERTTRATPRYRTRWSAAIGSPVRSGSTRCSPASPLAS